MSKGFYGFTNKKTKFFLFSFAIILGFIIYYSFIKNNNILQTIAMEKSNTEKHKNNLLKHVETLSLDIGERNPLLYNNLEKAAQYIENQLKLKNFKHSRQEYIIYDKSYYNLIYELTGKKNKLAPIILGAHYDTVEGTPGADDNASAVAVLIEMAKELDKHKFQHPITIVFFTLEEPPYFKSKNMGSIQFADDLKQRKKDVKLMICLEMLGFYTEEKTQQYPNPLMYLKYPKEGNFIGVVGTFSYSEITNKFYEVFKNKMDFPSEILIAPALLPGVDYSDHYAFWKNDYPALMLTDSAFYRNDNYHTAGDLPDTLDYDKMASLTYSLIETIKVLDTKI